MAVTGQIGDAEVRLDNAADQAVMEKILAEIRQLNGTMTTGGTGGGGGGGGVGGLVSNATKLGKTINIANIAVGAFGKGLGLATFALTKMVSVGASAVNLTTGFVQAQPKITDFTKSLSNLPGVLGDLGSAVHAVTDMLHKNYTTFQQLTTSGIAFGDRLESMTRLGARFGVSLSDVAGNLASNSESLARLGTGTRGATLAIDAASVAFAQNKDILLAFGMTFEEQNENFMKFFSQNALALQRGTITQQEIINMSDDYAKGLRRLSELTGIQADQLQEGVDKANMNRAFENFISKMDGETQNRMRAILNTVQAGFGDAGREAAMAAIMGVAPVTEGAANMLSLNRDFGGLLRGLNSSALGFSGTLEQFNTMMYGQMNQFANANRGFADANSKYFAVLDMYGDQFGGAGGALIGGINMFAGSISDIESRLGRRSPLNSLFAQLEITIQELRDAFGILIEDLLYDVRFQNALQTFTQGVRNAGPAIAQFIGDFATEEGRQKNLDKIFDALATGFHEMMLRINDTWLGYFISNDAMEVREKEKLQARVNEGSLNREGLQQIVDDETAFSPTREAARQLITEMQNATSREYSPETTSGQNLRSKLNEFIDREFGPTFRAAGGNWTSGMGLQYGRVDLSELNAMRKEAGLPEYSNYNQFEADARKYGDFMAARSGFNPDYSLLTSQGIENLINTYPELRHGGSYGMTGRIIEPRGTFARLRPGETVHTQAESRAINELLRTGSGGIEGMANKIVDSNRETSVKLLEALNMLARKTEDQKGLTRQLISAVEHYGTA